MSVKFRDDAGVSPDAADPSTATLSVPTGTPTFVAGYEDDDVNPLPTQVVDTGEYTEDRLYLDVASWAPVGTTIDLVLYADGAPITGAVAARVTIIGPAIDATVGFASGHILGFAAEVVAPIPVQANARLRTAFLLGFQAEAVAGPVDAATGLSTAHVLGFQAQSTPRPARTGLKTLHTIKFSASVIPPGPSIPSFTLRAAHTIGFQASVIAGPEQAAARLSTAHVMGFQAAALMSTAADLRLSTGHVLKFQATTIGPAVDAGSFVLTTAHVLGMQASVVPSTSTSVGLGATLGMSCYVEGAFTTVSAGGGLSGTGFDSGVLWWGQTASMSYDTFIDDVLTVTRVVRGLDPADPIMSASLSIRKRAAESGSAGAVFKKITTTADNKGHVFDDGTADSVGVLQFELSKSDITKIGTPQHFVDIRVTTQSGQSHTLEAGTLRVRYGTS